MFSGLGATAQASLSFNAGGSSGTSTSSGGVNPFQIIQKVQSDFAAAQRKAMIEASRKASSDAASKAGAFAAQAEAAAKRVAAERSLLTSSVTAPVAPKPGVSTGLLVAGAAVVAAGVVGYLVLRK